MKIDVPAWWDSYEVLEALAPQAQSYLCIGVQEGECLMRLLRGNPGIKKLALCDTWGREFGGTGRGSHAHIAQRLDQIGWKGIVHWLDGDSKELIPTIKENFDLSYVDGAHDEPSAFLDLTNVWPLTTFAMVCHDTRQIGVWAALSRFLDTAPTARVVCAMGGFGTAIVYRRSDA